MSQTFLLSWHLILDKFKKYFLVSMVDGIPYSEMEKADQIKKYGRLACSSHNRTYKLGCLIVINFRFLH